MLHKATWSCGVTVLLLVTFFALVALAQGNDAMGNSGKAKSSGITGCIQKGEEPNGYTLKADDGSTYELMSDSVNLGDHVGHTVTLTGTKTHESKAEEKQRTPWEKKEAGGSKYSDFKVTDVTMVSDSCK